MKHKMIKEGDEDITKSVELTQMELKVLYNECVSVLEDMPEMKTFYDAAKKLKKAIKQDVDCGCDDEPIFYGVNEFMGVTRVNDTCLGIELVVQGTDGPTEDKMVLIIDEFFFDMIKKEIKYLKKNEKIVNKF